MSIFNKIKGIVRRNNPSAQAQGELVDPMYDSLGRQVTYPYQVRDNISTARASVANGTETTLFAGVAGTKHDLLYVSGSNDSDAAVSADIRDATGGGIITTLHIPANATEFISFPAPVPQNFAADTWTVDIPDITGTTVNISALFIKNV